jgi:RHS repeat-associated protein
MSKTSGVAPEVLSLPKGGGAVQSLGTTFETDLCTGTGSYSVALDVPAGPNGVQPQIAIRYQSAAGGGPFGIGWTLGLLSVTRKIEGRIPNYGPADDLFTMPGVEDLIPIGDGAFRPRVDTMHWRIRRQGDGWELTDVQGHRHRLGMSPSGRVEIVEGGLTKTAQWLLEEMALPSGDTIVYSYLADGPQRYLSTVEWGTYRLEFHYKARPDTLTSGRYGFLIQTKRRCSRIELHTTTIAPTLCRSWTLDYVQAAGNALSLLHRVTLRGHAADGSSLAAPTLTFGYTEMTAPVLQRFDDAIPNAMPGTFDAGRVELLDWDGDGLPDLLELTRTRVRVWPNLGRGRWGFPQTVPQLPTPVALDEAGVAFADMDGSGTADLILLDRRLPGYYPLLPGGGFGAPVFWSQTPSTRLSSGDARLVDLNGDGITDLLQTGDAFFSLFLRDDVNGGWEATPRAVPIAEVPPVSFRDPHVRLADLNGDGLQDLVRIDGGGITYWPYLGNGRWGDPVEMANPPQLPLHFDPRRLTLADVDGDGCADLIYVDFGRVLVYLNHGGVRWGDAQETAYTPPAQPSQVRIADMNGTGTVGVLWSAVNDGISRQGYVYLDLAGGTKPYLLNAIDNGMGLTSRIVYRASTDFAVDAADAGEPWQTFHPFPIPVVAQMDIADSVTGLVSTTRHHYHEARYDADQRTFLGFAVVDVDALGDDAIPTMRIRNFYHLGLDMSDVTRPLEGEERQQFAALRRRLLRTEITGLDASPDQSKPYSVVTHDYTTRVETAANGANILVPIQTSTVARNFERADTEFSTHTISYLEVDAHGNVTKQRQVTQRVGMALPDQDVTTETTFAIDATDAHLVSFPVRVTQRDAAGLVLSSSVTHYDGPAHEGLPEGQITAGNVTRQEVLAIPDELATEVYGAELPDFAGLAYRRRPGESGWWVRQHSYELQDSPMGRTLITRNARGFDTHVQLDATRQYAVKLTDALGNVTTATPEPRAFQTAALTDPNGNVTADRFDALGRVSATLSPGDTDALPCVGFSYRTDSLPIRFSTVNREQVGQPQGLDQFTYVDGRGNLLCRIVEGEGDPGREFIVQEAQEFTARGQVKARVLPYYTVSSEYSKPQATLPRTRLTYDAIGRIVANVRTSGDEVVFHYAPGVVETVDLSTPDKKSIRKTLDGLGRVLSIQRTHNAAPVMLRYEYSPLNKPTRVLLPVGGEARLTYDLLGRLLAQDMPDSGRTQFILDAAGNQIQRISASGKVVSNGVDALDRLVEVRADGVVETTYRYVNSGDPPEMTPPDGVQNRIGRLYSLTDAIGTLTSSYDARGNLIKTRRSIDALGGREMVTDIEYDALGRQTSLTLPEAVAGAGRRVVQYTYNARGMADRSPGFVTGADYDAAGRMRALRFQNGAENRYDFDPGSGLPTRIQVVGPGGVVYRDQSFTFDPNGNLLQIVSPVPAEAGTFTYDDLDRLLSADYASGETFAYAYSDDGNITHGGAAGDLTYGSTPGTGQVHGAGGDTYTYDVDGRMITAPFGSLEFNAIGSLTQVGLPAGGSVDYTYDFRGQMARKVVAGVETYLLADVSVEFHDGQPVIWIMFGKQRILALVGGTGFFVHPDFQGSPSLVTNLTGDLVRRLAFGPYGTLRSDSAAGVGPPGGPRFVGELPQADTGLIVLGLRFYDPRLGRFVSPDLIVPDIFGLDGWNLYIYAHNNPLRYHDPTGLSAADVWAAIGIGVLVAALVVAGFFTMGSTWAVAGVVITTNLGGLLIGTAIGVAGGAILGGMAAARAGGDIWKGILLGGLIGGVSAFVGGALGGMAFNAIGTAGKLATYGAFISQGVIQGTFIGAGTGAAIGYAGGQGTPHSFWLHLLKGAAMGALTGALFGAVAAQLQGSYLQIGTLAKFNPVMGQGANDPVTFVDQYGSTGQDLGRWLTEGPNANGYTEFINVQEGAFPGWVGHGALLNFPVSWVPTALGQYGGFMLVTQASIGLDKFGVLNYEDQVIFLLNVVPLLGIALGYGEIGNMDWYNWLKNDFLHSGFSMQTIAS